MVQHKIFALLIAGVAAVLLAPHVSAQSILGSAHDMTTQGSTGTDQVCVFCHTPHGADTGASAPLWNRVLDTTQTYQRYSSLGSATLDGDEAPVGSISLACLSCHDGTQARDVVINTPGQGGHSATGSPIGGTSTLGVLSGSPIPALGTDLRDDHPVSIQYAGGACQGTTADCDPSTAASGDPDFEVAQYASINGLDNWWVDTEATPNDTRNKTDMILYARSDFINATGVGPSVECGSCHDPHDSTLQPLSFMRISNSASAVCLACHIK